MSGFPRNYRSVEERAAIFAATTEVHEKVSPEFFPYTSTYYQAIRERSAELFQQIDPKSESSNAELRNKLMENFGEYLLGKLDLDITQPDVEDVIEVLEKLPATTALESATGRQLTSNTLSPT